MTTPTNLLMKTILSMLMAALSAGEMTCLSGCSILNTGPAMAERVVSTGQAVAFKLIDQTSPESGQAGVHGNLTDPRYGLKMFVGTGVYFDLAMWLQGADFSMDIMANLIQQVGVDPDLRERVASILQHPDMADDTKRDQIIQLLVTALETRANGEEN